MEFKAFSDIVRLSSSVSITEKLDGTNAQILIWSEPGTTDETSGMRFPCVLAGSRNRWLTPDDDNYGFARWVHDYAPKLFAALGPGRHFGEWYGSGIQSGYGLSKGEKRFALFDTRFEEKFRAGELPPGVSVVPLLYRGPWKDGIVTEVMADLKANGSKAAPGFMRPEGVVIRFDRNGAMFKQVFEAEETAWKPKPSKTEIPTPESVLPYLQPIRLQKLGLRDERLLLTYPESLPQLAAAYIADLEKESPEFVALDAATAKAVRKQVFPWIKTVFSEMGYRA